MTPETESSELREYLGALWQRKLLVAVVVAATVAAALFYSVQQTPEYKSSAQVLVDALPVEGQSYTTINMASEELIAKSPAVSTIARKSLPRNRVVPGDVSVASSVDDNTLTFTATSSDPKSAKLTAQAFADAYLQNRREQLQANLKVGEDAINSVIDGLNKQMRAAEADLAAARAHGDTSGAEVAGLRISALSAQISTQQASLNQLLLQGSAPVGEVLNPAALPGSPSSPDYGRNVLLSLLVGLAFGVGAASLAERLDERLRRREDVERTTGAPLIARVPKAIMPDDGVLILEDPHAEASEAFRGLRARVLYSASQHGARTIMVTSFEAGEGKTTTAVNLAAALADTGKRTVLISGDLHRPGVHGLFGVENGPGLSGVLLEEVDLVAALAPTAVENLSVLPSGRPIANASELIGSETMSEVIGKLEAHWDFVIIDAPPLVGASDTLSLAPLARWVLLVADVRRSKRSSIKEAAIELHSVGASLLGVVLTHDSSKGRRYYHYYRHRERQLEQAPTKPPVANVLGGRRGGRS